MGLSILHPLCASPGLSKPVQLVVMEVAPAYARVKLGLHSLVHFMF